MSLWQDFRRKSGQTVGAVGSWLGLPEMGVSEKIANAPAPGGMYFPRGEYQNVAGAQDTYSPTWGAKQGGGVAAPNVGNVPTGPSDAEKSAWEASYRQVMGDYDDQLRAVEASRLGIMNQAKQFRKAHQRELGKLGTQKDTTLGGQSAYFSNIGPDVYQSGQEIYKNKALKEYEQGKTDLSQQLQYNEQELGRNLASLSGQTGAIQRGQETAAAQLEAGTGEVAPTEQHQTGITPSFKNYDISKIYNNLSQLYLMNTLQGLTPDQNQANIRTAIDSQIAEPDIKDYLYQQLFGGSYA